MAHVGTPKPAANKLLVPSLNQSTHVGTPTPLRRTNASVVPLSPGDDEVEDTDLYQLPPSPDEDFLLSPSLRSPNASNGDLAGDFSPTPVESPAGSIMAQLGQSDEEFLMALSEAGNDEQMLINQALIARKEGNATILEEALNAGLDVNTIIDTQTNDTLLHVFTIEGHVECVQLLLERGATLNGEPPTAFHFACELGLLGMQAHARTHTHTLSLSLSLSLSAPLVTCCSHSL
jgi:hypothetical protein